MSQHKISQTEYSRSNAYSEESYYDMMRIPENYQEGTIHDFYPVSKKQTLSYDVPKGIEEYTYLYNKTKEGHNEEKSTSEIFSYIQNPVDYDKMADQEVREERQELEEHLKFLNQYLNSILKKHIIKHTKQEKKNHRKLYNDELSRPAQQKTVQNNTNLIKLLDNQYKSLKNKLLKFQSCTSKYDNDCQANTITEEIKKIKLDIIERKRKLVLNQKKIVNKDCSKDDKDKQFYDLQQQFITYSKKKDKLNRRLEELESENEKLLDRQEKITHELEQKNPNIKEFQKEKKNQLQQEHLQTLYTTNRRKLQLQLRKREREEQQFKRKYYNLLKTYEKAIENGENLDAKIKQAERNIMKHNYAFMKKKKQVTESDKSDSEEEEQEEQEPSVKEEPYQQKTETPIVLSKNSLKNSNIKKSKQHDNDDSCIDGFMLTEINQMEKSKDDSNCPNPHSDSEKQINQPSKIGINSESSDHPKSTKFHIRKKYRTQKIKTEQAPRESSSNVDSSSIIRKIDDVNIRSENKRQWTQENKNKRKKRNENSVNQNESIKQRSQLVSLAQLQKLDNAENTKNKERSKRIRTEAGTINHQKSKPMSYHYAIETNKSDGSQNVSLHSKLKKIVNGESSEKQYLSNNASKQEYPQEESEKNSERNLKGESEPIYYKSQKKEEKVGRIQRQGLSREQKPLIGEGIEKISSENYEQDFFEEFNKNEIKMIKRENRNNEEVEENIIDDEQDSSYNADFDNFSP